MNTRERNGKKGMTLVEILIVIALIGVLAGVMMSSLGSIQNSGKEGAAKIFCQSTVANAIYSYKTTKGVPPKDMAALTEFFGGKEPLDPWNNPYGIALDSKSNILVWSSCNNGPAEEANITDLGFANPGAGVYTSTQVEEINKGNMVDGTAIPSDRHKIVAGFHSN